MIVPFKRNQGSFIYKILFIISPIRISSLFLYTSPILISIYLRTQFINWTLDNNYYLHVFLKILLDFGLTQNSYSKLNTSIL